MKKIEYFTKLSEERRRFLKKLLRGTMLASAAILTAQVGKTIKPVYASAGSGISTVPEPMGGGPVTPP